MTMAHTRNKLTRKTLAVALAASVSLGGVQIAGSEMGFNTVAEASAAETIETGKNYPAFNKTIWEKTQTSPPYREYTDYAVIVSQSDVEKGSFTINDVVEDGKNVTATLLKDESQAEVDGIDSINLSPEGDLTLNYEPGVKRSMYWAQIELQDESNNTTHFILGLPANRGHLVELPSG